MRNFLGPAFLLLAAAGLLYTSFHTNRRVFEATGGQQPSAIVAALELVHRIQGRAQAFKADLQRWPDTLEDLELNPQDLAARQRIQSVRLGHAGAVAIVIPDMATGQAATWVWSPRQQGATTVWDCRTDSTRAADSAPPCAQVAAAELDVYTAPGRADTNTDADTAVPGVDERCQRIGRIAYAAAHARDAGDSLDTFFHRPIIAFVDDSAQRDDLKSSARQIYAAPAQSPSATQRHAMKDQRCLPPQTRP